MDILETTNPTWGFYGAFSYHATDPSGAWPLVSEAIAKATGCPAKCIKRFLDSSQGRVFADAVIIALTSATTLETAVDFVVKRWMHLKITSTDESDYGIRAGLPYLTGFACHCELEADTGAPRAAERPSKAREASR